MSKSDSFLIQNWTDEYLNERLEMPQVWTTFNGFEIQELKSNRVDEVIDIIKKYYIVEEPLMVGCQMYLDHESVNQYLYLVRSWMMDSISTVAVEQETGNLIGFIICRFNELTKRDHIFRKEMIYEGIKWNELNKFYNYLIKMSNVHEHYNVDTVLEIYSWFVLPNYRGKGIGSELLKNVILRQLAEFEWFDVYVITGVFTSKTSQLIAKSFGLDTSYDYVFAEWIVKDDDEEGSGEIFFKIIMPGNYSAKVMSMRFSRASKTTVKSRELNSNISENN